MPRKVVEVITTVQIMSFSFTFFTQLIFSVKSASEVEWRNVESLSSQMGMCIKQGGVASPTLFNIYLDKLCKLLIESGYGCHIGNHYMGVWGLELSR